MIPLAIAIGIIEDKIANDLTGNKSTKEHLEELKEKFLNSKNETIDIIRVRTTDEKLAFTKVEEMYFKNNFLVLVENKGTTYINVYDIREIKRIDKVAEE